MARLWSSGFELNSNTAGMEWTVISGSPTIQTTTVRSGTYAGQITSLSSGTPKYWLYKYAAAVSNVNFQRFYFRVATLPSAENRIFVLNNSSDVSTPLIYITIGSGGALRLYDEDGAIGSASSALSTNSWYRIETEFDISAAAGSHIVKARIDGVEFAAATNRSIGVGALAVAYGGNLGSEAQTTGNWYYDDIAINDNTGSFQNSYPGEGEIIFLLPNAAGDNAGWTEGTSALFSAIDEIPPNTTDYIATHDLLISDFNLADTPAALESTDTINVVQVGVRFSKDDIDPGFTFVTRFKVTPGGTVEEGTGISPTSTTYFSNRTADPRNPALTLYDFGFNFHFFLNFIIRGFTLF